jgi:C4-dicarboxylate-specific signal transduction histidine kinase
MHVSIFDGSLLSVAMATGREIAQVVTNLLLNALDATPADGQISVHLYPASTWLCAARNQCGYCLSVANTDSGIPPNTLPGSLSRFSPQKVNGEQGWGCARVLSIMLAVNSVRSSL